jgi:2-oxoglutarate dehydrogenase E1 component
VSEFVFGTHNAAFVQVMYEQYLRDPASVPDEWRQLFDNGRVAELPIIPTTKAELKAPPPQIEAPAPPARAAAAPVPSAPSAVPVTATDSVLTPLTGGAARLVRNMEDSLAVPTATSFRELPVATLDARRKELNAALASRGQKLSYTHLIAWAIVRAAIRFPVMTQAFREVDGKPNRFDPRGVHLGLAVDVEKKDGTRTLVVPVIKRAEAMAFRTFHEAYEGLVDKARTGKLLPDDFAGGTITLTNPGTIGTVASVPRLMAGQGTIIATGAIRDVAGAKLMTVSSTYDHRIIQGAESGMFLRQIEALLQGEDRFYESVADSLGVPELVKREAGSEKRDDERRASGEYPVPAPRPVIPERRASSQDELRNVAAAMALVRAFRSFGYLAAPLDPLGNEPTGDPSLDPTRLGLTPEIMARIPAEVLRIYVPGRTLAEALPELRRTWCGPIAYEVEHIASHDERVWLRRVIESGEHRRLPTVEDRRRLLSRLTQVEALERFLHRTYLGQKRFSIEGLDMLVPMLDLTIEIAAAGGARDVLLGMAHRGRLNVLAHIVGVPYQTILNEFEGGRHHVDAGLPPEGYTGDVKYHHGAEGVYEAAGGRRVTVTLSPNPSHLEAVNPVVLGRTRAEQTDRTTRDARQDTAVALPVLIHGDASFAAQGSVAETFNLARLRGYATGGTLHLIANNQVGFTTDPRDARSTDYASDLAKGFDVPIVHVNADDPEACLAAIRLALMYRDRFRSDIVIDVVGYRRHGHNEADEPAYTQPVLYERIRRTPPVRQRYAELLEREGVVNLAEAAAEAETAYNRLAEIQQQIKEQVAHPPPASEAPVARQAAPEPETAVAAERLRELNEQLLQVPEGLTVNPKLARQLDRRREAVGPNGEIEWAHAEALAFASLLVERTPIRLTGQDTERGTFSQRHLVLHDAANGKRHAPLQHLSDAQAPFELYNSPLSELACLGFEYGYAVQAPEALVLWEAQFGDFANGAEVVIDQFIIAGLAKWGETSRLGLLLPHGYEGQGPEHSSARLERYLALGAEGNIRVANCTTAAQYFHLLRRQARHQEMRPLVVMTPKSLLRLPAATSHVEELATGRFQPVLDDPAARERRAKVTRLVLCSGKIYYDLLARASSNPAPHVAIARVELLYPFPTPELKELAARYEHLSEAVWVQEEPRNMGARKFVLPKLREHVLPDRVAIRDVSRPERSSPAEGYPAAHQAEQERIVGEALA